MTDSFMYENPLREVTFNQKKNYFCKTQSEKYTSFSHETIPPTNLIPFPFPSFTPQF